MFRNRLRPEHEAAYRDELADPDSHGAWRDHPGHREAQRHGVADYYAEY